MSKLDILSAGAAMGLVRKLEPEFSRMTGFDIGGTFGAVGAIREKLEAGAPCDLILLTEALILDLAARGKVDASSVAVVGRVSTGLAVCTSAPSIRIDAREDLRAALEAASALYFPDPQRATAGIHFNGVLDALEISAPRRTYPNGAEAMKAMAASGDPAAIGCTQESEILYTEGVRYAGPLPNEFALATTYAMAVVSGAPQASAGRAFIKLLSSPESTATRRGAGFN
jgi:molybdate transport system substrate-binding protein